MCAEKFLRLAVYSESSDRRNALFCDHSQMHRPSAVLKPSRGLAEADGLTD
jgi:hypothetical protein